MRTFIPRWRQMNRVLFTNLEVRWRRLLPALLVISGLGMALAACGGASDQSSEIGQKIGGTCTAESYELILRISNTHERIYDCTVNGKLMCVTYEGSIANDSTAAVRLVFANTLGAQRPSCLG